MGNADNGVRFLANIVIPFPRTSSITTGEVALFLEWRSKNSTDVKLQFGRSMTVGCAEDVLKLMLRLLSDETMPLTCSLLLWDGLALDCIQIQNLYYEVVGVLWFCFEILRC